MEDLGYDSKVQGRSFLILYRILETQLRGYLSCVSTPFFSKPLNLGIKK